MCLILFAWQPEAEYPLVVVANRDEFYQRATQTLAPWPGSPIVAGRDLQAGGTWMGVTPEGRFAAVTNYRRPQDMGKAFSISRGSLCQDYLESDLSPEDYLRKIGPDAMKAGGFNLIIGTRTQLAYGTNRYPGKKDEPEWHCQSALQAGIYGLSNERLNSPWPKALSGQKKLKQQLQQPLSEKGLLSIVQDTFIADDQLLPDTGIGLEKERFLAPAFIISSETYGTRASTLLIRDQAGNQTLVEQSWHPLAATGQKTRVYLSASEAAVRSCQ